MRQNPSPKDSHVESVSLRIQHLIPGEFDRPAPPLELWLLVSR